MGTYIVVLPITDDKNIMDTCNLDNEIISFIAKSLAISRFRKGS